MSASVREYDVSIGPVRGEALCRHAECFVLPTDPDPALMRTCEHEGVFFVPRPDTDAPVSACAWHLARFLDAFPEQAAKLEADWNAQEYAADPAITALEDKQAPSTFESNGRRWKRAALDQAGRVHYVNDDVGEPAMLEVEADLETVHPTPLAGLGVEGYLQDIRDRRGWAALDSEVVASLLAAAGGEGGGG